MDNLTDNQKIGILSRTLSEVCRHFRIDFEARKPKDLSWYEYGPSKGCYPYIAFENFGEWMIRMSEIIASLGGAYGLKFCEIGAGNGIFSLMAQKMGLDVTLIEYDSNHTAYLYNLQKSMGKKKFHIFLKDAFDHDYTEYDIVYSYIPFVCSSLHTKFIEEKLSGMKINSWAYLPGFFSHTLVKKAGFTEYGDAIYLKTN